MAVKDNSKFKKIHMILLKSKDQKS